MNLEFTQEQSLLTHMVERFTSDHYDLSKRANYVKSTQGFSKKNWELMAQMGLMTVPFSEENGGLGGGAEDLICIMRPLGKSVTVEPLLFSTVLAGSLLEAVGTQAQKDKWIANIIDGSAQLALAHSETAARFDLGFVETTFKTENGQTRLSGRKTLVLGCAAADGFIVSAVPEKTTGVEGKVSFFLVKKDAANMVVRDYRLMDGSIACELDLHGSLAAPMAGSFEDLQSVICLTKIAACAELVGLMELLFEQTLEHLKTREQFGRPLSKMQALQHRLADSFVTLELCKAHLLRMAASQKSDSDYVQMTAGSKAYISRAAVKLAEESVQLHGGMGITDELIVGHAMKRILLLSTLFGDPDYELKSFMKSAA